MTHDISRRVRRADRASGAKAGREDQNIALVLAGGIGLGAYQAGVYSALHAKGRYRVVWTAGSSVGAVNAALIAGNKADDRLSQLRRFWMSGALSSPFATRSGPVRHVQNWMSVMQGRLFGVHGHFTPSWTGIPPRAFTSVYSLRPMRARLRALIDFDRLNSGDIRISVATTDIETGELIVFDTGQGRRVEIDHLLASCGYLPEFAPVEIDGRFLGDGGLSANAPIDAVLDDDSQAPALIFVADLFARDGSRPRDFATAVARKSDLMFANQTHQRLEAFRREAALRDGHGHKRRRIVYLSYRAPDHEAGPEKAFDYSRQTLEERWQAGVSDYADANRLLEADHRDVVVRVRRN